MTKDDDTAALIAEARIWLQSGDGFAPTLYVTQKDRDIGPLLYRLTAALERAQQDAARMREALSDIATDQTRPARYIDGTEGDVPVYDEHDMRRIARAAIAAALGGTDAG